MAKIAILAGEPSGDLIASQLMAYIRTKVKNIEFIGVGGPLMKQEGLNLFSIIQIFLCMVFFK